MNTVENNPPPNHGRTIWDILAGTVQSKIIFYSIIGLIFALILYFLWDIITIIPLYAISAMALSLLWYNPISSWLSLNSTFIEVWCPDTNTLTTYRAGKNAFAELERQGIQNIVTSLAGSKRIFANKIDLENSQIETSWVHQCDPWSYHIDRTTLYNMSNRLSNVLNDIVEAESMAQIKGREHAMNSMRNHYQTLDKIFFGETEPEVTSTNDDTETPE